MAAPDLDERKQLAHNAIDAESEALRELSLRIHANPELNFEEHRAQGWLCDYLESQGFEVARGVYGLETAFRAVAGSGGPTIAVFCEYDALPGIGHACGHNLIAIAGVAVGLALKEALPPGAGTVVVLGSPAEEGGGGKVFMADRGALEGVDAAMMLHPAGGDAAWGNLIAREEIRVEYFGRSAHAGAAPWAGVNALDALVTAYTAISAMRQQIRPTDRVHGVITRGGDRPNIIPEHTSADFYIRSRNRVELEELREKVMGCFEGAARASGCRLEHSIPSPTYFEVMSNDIMAELYRAQMADLGVQLPTREQQSGGIGGASTDMGNVSYLVPSIHPIFGIPTNAPNHTPGFTAAAATEEAHANTIRAAKALASTALELYLRPELLQDARKEFEARTAEFTAD